MKLIEFYAPVFCRASGLFNKATGLVESGQQLNEQQWREVAGPVGEMFIECERLGFMVAADKISDITSMLDAWKETDSFNESIMAKEVQELHSRIVAELKGPAFFMIGGEIKDYYENNKFSEEARLSFPSCEEDMVEAGRCFALSRYTACVFHLNRIIEAGLQVLAKNVGVRLRNDWGGQLKEILTELEKRYKAAGARTPDELFFSEAASQISHIKHAWRNPTMHIERNTTKRCRVIFSTQH